MPSYKVKLIIDYKHARHKFNQFIDMCTELNQTRA